MRNSGVKALVVISVASLLSCSVPIKDVETDEAAASQRAPSRSFDSQISSNASDLMKEGQRIFRFDTFGSETYWGDQLRLHQAIAGEKYGGVGPGITPRQALQLGLKVDVGALPKILVEALKGGKVNLDDPGTTMELLRANSVVGVTMFFNKDKKPVSMGIQCALCHSTVDDSFASGIGRRLDGWPNRDLNVGAIVAAAPNLQPMAAQIGIPEDKLRAVLNSWGPGKYDAEVNQDGKGARPDGRSGATLIPAAFGLAGQNLHTYSGWGSVPYWNVYVAITQMHGLGVFFDPRLDDAKKYPVASRNRIGHIRSTPDLVTAKLPALQYYQLSIPAPKPPKDSFDAAAAQRGKALFEGKATCSTCHVPPLFSEPGWPMHTAREMGIDSFQADRSPDQRYRTTPLAGLFARSKGGFYHDGRFPDLMAVVNNYDSTRRLSLAQEEKRDLVEYLKSL